MLKVLIPVAGAGALAFGAAMAPAESAERAVPIPAAAIDAPAVGNNQVAVLAGGCFWGMEAVFQQVKGVKAVTAGYAGGTAQTANYPDVSSETTRHAEAIRITYDPHQVSYGTLLRVYFSVAHDPTTLNYQGPDHGTSYRSAIFPQNAAQRRVAAAYIAQLGKADPYGKPIVTKIETGQFFPAEAYHQNFYQRNPDYPYIVHWDKPKVAAFRAAFPKLARPAGSFAA